MLFTIFIKDYFAIFSPEAFRVQLYGFSATPAHKVDISKTEDGSESVRTLPLEQCK